MQGGESTKAKLSLDIVTASYNNATEAWLRHPLFAFMGRPIVIEFLADDDEIITREIPDLDSRGIEIATSVMGQFNLMLARRNKSPKGLALALIDDGESIEAEIMMKCQSC